MKNIKLFILVAIWLAWPSQIKAQSNDTLAMQWSLIDSLSGSNVYGGTYRTVNILSNSSIVATLTDSNNTFRLHKYSKTGSLVKTKAYTAGYGGCNLSAKDNNDNIYLTGSFNHINTTIPNASILKYDKALKLKWERNILPNEGFGRLYLDGNNNLLALGITIDSVAAPISKHLNFIKKYDGLGNLLLTINISKDTFWLYDIATGLNNEIYVCGALKDNNNKFTFCFIKYNALGVFQYTKSYPNTTTNKNDFAMKIRVDKLGNVLVYGKIRKNFSVTLNSVCDQYYLAKYTPTGTKIWQSTYLDESFSTIYATTTFLEIDNYNNIYIGVYYDNDDDGGIVNVIKKFNSAGVKLWDKIFNSFESAPTKVKLSKAGYLCFAMDNDWDVSHSSTIYQIDSSGNIILKNNLRGHTIYNPDNERYITDFDLNKNNNDFVLVGSRDTYNPDITYPYIIKYAVPPARATNQKTILNISVYPNPASDFINVNSDDQIKKIEFYNSTGGLVKTIINFNSEPIDISSFTNGLFLIKAYTSSSTLSQRFIKL